VSPICITQWENGGCFGMTREGVCVSVLPVKRPVGVTRLLQILREYGPFRVRKPLLYPFELSGQTADDEWVPRNFLAASCSACNPFVSPDSLVDVQVPRSREGAVGCVQTAPFSTGCGAPFPACVVGELIRAAKTRRQAVLPSPGGQVRSGFR
jgi:hypothetical protein